MSGVAVRFAAPYAARGISNAQKLKYFKAGAWTSFAQEKLLQYGYSKLRKGVMSYRSGSGYRSPYAKGSRSYALQYYNRRPRRLTGVKRPYAELSQGSEITLATNRSVRKQILDAKQRKVEVYSAGFSLNTNILYSNQIGTGIDTGVTRGDRIADKIHVKYLRIELTLDNPNTASTGSGTLRFAVLQFKRPTQSLPKEKLFESRGDDNNPEDWLDTNVPRQLLSQFNKNAITVLHDRRHRFLSLNANTLGRHHFAKVFNVPINRTISYNTDVDPLTQILPNIRIVAFVQKDNEDAQLFTLPIELKMRVYTHYTDGAN